MVRQLITRSRERVFDRKSLILRVWLSTRPVLLTLKMLHSVPISKLPQLVHETQQDIERSGILYTVVGHAGDGG
jgi:hypothetical protein